MTSPLVICAQAARTFGRGETATLAVAQTDCEIHAGDRIALVGPSGSGKSTLLHLIAGLDQPTHGSVQWPAIGTREELRPGRVAVVFQGPTLIPSLSILENAALPLILDGSTDADARAAAARALSTLGLDELAEKLPEEISGGQAQRVSIARALAGRPQLILADEPTGQLDAGNGALVVDVLLRAADDAQAGLLLTTHDPAVAARMATRWEMHSGHLNLPVLT